MAQGMMSRTTFGAALAAGGNNLGLMRLAGALLVLASHAWVLTGHADDEPFARALGRYTDGGGLAVAMFFAVSGCLIARSAEVHPWRAYVAARARRIYPAFAMVVVLQTLVLGVAATRQPWREYLADGATWDALLRGLVFSPRLGLPGVFETNPVPFAVNGSLWTLRIEVLCYAGLLALAGVGALRRGRVLLVVGAGFGALAVAVAMGAGLRVTSIVDCGLHFTMGAALWSYRDAVPRRWWMAAAGVAGLVLAAGTPAAPFAWHAVLPYVVLWAGLSAPVLPRFADVSYGTYLYAFPIEQGLVAWVGPGPITLLAYAAPLAVLCGVVSCILVERPAMRPRGRPQ